MSGPNHHHHHFPPPRNGGGRPGHDPRRHDVWNVEMRYHICETSSW